MIELLVSKYGNTKVEDTSITIAQDEHLPTMQNLINHNNDCNYSSTNQPSFEALISHNNPTQISWQENIDNKNDDIQSILESFNDEAPSEYLYCHNCNRSQNRTLLESYGNDSPYFTLFLIHSTLHVHRIRRFKFVSSTTNESSAEEITLCYECAHHLVIENYHKTANKNKFDWLSFIRNLLNNNYLWRAYGEQLWTFISPEWRFSWIKKANEICSPNVLLLIILQLK